MVVLHTLLGRLEEQSRLAQLFSKDNTTNMCRIVVGALAEADTVSAREHAMRVAGKFIRFVVSALE